MQLPVQKRANFRLNPAPPDRLQSRWIWKLGRNIVAWDSGLTSFCGIQGSVKNANHNKNSAPRRYQKFFEKAQFTRLRGWKDSNWRGIRFWELQRKLPLWSRRPLTRIVITVIIWLDLGKKICLSMNSKLSGIFKISEKHGIYYKNKFTTKT